MDPEHGGPGEEAAKWKPKGPSKLEGALAVGAAALTLSGDMQRPPEATADSTHTQTVDKRAVKSNIGPEDYTKVRESAKNQIAEARDKNDLHYLLAKAEAKSKIEDARRVEELRAQIGLPNLSEEERIKDLRATERAAEKTRKNPQILPNARWNKSFYESWPSSPPEKSLKPPRK